TAAVFLGPVDAHPPGGMGLLLPGALELEARIGVDLVELLRVIALGEILLQPGTQVPAKSLLLRREVEIHALPPRSHTLAASLRRVKSRKSHTPAASVGAKHWGLCPRASAGTAGRMLRPYLFFRRRGVQSPKPFQGETVAEQVVQLALEFLGHYHPRVAPRERRVAAEFVGPLPRRRQGSVRAGHLLLQPHPPP